MRFESHSSQLCAWHSEEGTKDLWIWAGSYKQNCEEEPENSFNYHSLVTSQEQYLQKANRLIQRQTFQERRQEGLWD